MVYSDNFAKNMSDSANRRPEMHIRMATDLLYFFWLLYSVTRSGVHNDPKGQ